jgi:hypothetical protein
MSPFASTLERPGEAERERPVMNGEIRFCDDHGKLVGGKGETPTSRAIPFARFVAKTSFPVSGDGAVIVASFATDTTTRSGGRSDDSSLDDR